MSKQRKVQARDPIAVSVVDPVKTWQFTAHGGRPTIVLNGTEVEAQQLLARMNNGHNDYSVSAVNDHPDAGDIATEIERHRVSATKTADAANVAADSP